MSNIWFISDTHFNHSNILNFVNDEGKPIRPNFKDVDHMNQTMINYWNQLVMPNDKVYHLGDVAFGNEEKAQPILAQLNGKKRLILGNHDNFDMAFYNKHFERISSWRWFGEFEYPFVACHFPLHGDSFMYKKNKSGITPMCVHGHVHNNTLKDTVNYLNISVENILYRPIHIDDIQSMIRKQR